MGRAVGIIPARYGSVRFPGKVLVPVGGTPLVVRVLEQVRRADCLDAVYVATDDPRVRAAVEAAGGQAVMTRPDHPSGTDRVAEAAAAVDADIVVNVQGDEPLVAPDLVRQVTLALRGDAPWDMATAAAPLRDPADLASPNVVKVVTDRTGRALYFSRCPIPFDRDAAFTLDGADPLWWRHIGIYGYRAAFLRRLVREPPCRLEQAEKLEQLRALDIGCRMKVIPAEHPGPGIDSPEDLARVEALLQTRKGP